MSFLSQLVQHRQKNRLNFLDKADQSGPTTNGEETIRELARKHFPQATEVPPEFYDSVRNISSKDLAEKYGEYVSPELVRRSMRMFKPYKAPGPDGFKPVMFKHLPAAFFERLAFIYKACLHFHYTPRIWRETWVVFIPKPGKASYREASSFRPICLSNYLIKGLERLICWRMQSHLYYLSLIHI